MRALERYCGSYLSRPPDASATPLQPRWPARGPRGGRHRHSSDDVRQRTPIDAEATSCRDDVDEQETARPQRTSCRKASLQAAPRLLNRVLTNTVVGRCGVEREVTTPASGIATMRSEPSWLFDLSSTSETSERGKKSAERSARGRPEVLSRDLCGTSAAPPREPLGGRLRAPPKTDV